MRVSRTSLAIPNVQNITFRRDERSVQPNLAIIHSITMEKAEKDEWSDNPSSVTSSFKLPNGGQQSPQRYSDVCGFGWRFAVLVTTEDSGPNTWPSPFEATRVQFLFDPHLIKGAALGTLKIRCWMEQSTPPGFHIKEQAFTSTMSLPGQSELPLGSYLLPKNLAPIVKFKVSFSDVLGLSFPSSFSKFKQVLKESFVGCDLVDTKLYMFTSLSREREATHPQALYASSSLLHGHSDYLDTCEDAPNFLQNLLTPSLIVLCGQGFRESELLDLDVDHAGDLRGGAYDYESDSDLDPDPGSEVHLEVSEATATASSESDRALMTVSLKPR